MKNFNSHCFMLPFSPYPILLITLNYMHVAFSARTFFLRITARRIFFQTSFPCRIFFFFWGGGGDCHPTAGYLKWSVPKQTNIQHLSYIECFTAFCGTKVDTYSRACDACVTRSLVIRWRVLGVRQQSVFLGSARPFWGFLLNDKWENIKKNRTAFSFSEHLYSSEKATATIVLQRKNYSDICLQPNRRQVDWKMSDKATSEPPWKASPM